MKTSKKKTVAKVKGTQVLLERALKKLKAQDIKEKLENSKVPVFIGIGNERFTLPSVGSTKTFLIEALQTIDKLDDKAVRKEQILTTQEIADFLNVSRPFVTKLIDEKKLKGFMVGNQRRASKAEVVRFKTKMRQEQEQALDSLAEETSKLGLK